MILQYKTSLKFYNKVYIPGMQSWFHIRISTNVAHHTHRKHEGNHYLNRVIKKHLIMSCCVLVVQLYLAFCYPVDGSLPGSSVHGGFSRQEYWSGLPCPPPGDLPNPGIKPGSPALQPDSLPAELPEKPC